MSEMNEHELIIRMVEGFKMASSAAKGLAHHQRNSDFLGISAIVDEISKNAARLATAKAMPELTLLSALSRQSKVAAKLSGTNG